MPCLSRESLRSRPDAVGRAASGSDYPHVLEFTPGNPGAWREKAVTLPDSYMSNMACGVLTVNSIPYIYCVGGNFGAGTTATARVFYYDPVTDTATSLTAA